VHDWFHLSHLTQTVSGTVGFGFIFVQIFTSLGRCVTLCKLSKRLDICSVVGFEPTVKSQKPRKDIKVRRLLPGTDCLDLVRVCCKAFSRYYMPILYCGLAEFTLVQLHF